MSPVENDGFSIFIFWSSREEAKSKRLVNVSHAMFALKYSHWNVNGLFLFLFRLWKLNLFKFLLLQLLFLDDNKLHSKSKVRSLEMTILRSPWDQKWACPNLLRRENDWNQSMKSFRNEISHDMEAEKYEAALNNICKTLLHCFSKQAAEAEEKSQVVIQKSSASFSNGKNDDRAQNSQHSSCCPPRWCRPCSIWKGSDMLHVNLSILGKCIVNITFTRAKRAILASLFEPFGNWPYLSRDILVGRGTM